MFKQAVQYCAETQRHHLEPAAKKNWVGTDPTVTDLGFPLDLFPPGEIQNVEMSEPCCAQSSSSHISICTHIIHIHMAHSVMAIR